MKFVVALALWVGCASEGGSDRAHLCLTCSDDVSVHVTSGLSPTQLGGARIELCIDGTTCARTTLSAACRSEACALDGAFAGTISWSSDGNLTVAVTGAASHTESETWTVVIQDAGGASLYISNASPVVQTNPATCHLDCRNVFVNL